MELIRRFPPQLLEHALSAWSWLPDLADKIPMVTSAFGDVFLQAKDGSIWFLDLVDGTLTKEWPDVVAFRRTLNTAEGQDRYLLADLVQHAERVDLIPEPTEVLSFTVPPVLGGALGTRNIRVVGLEECLRTASMLHQVTRTPVEEEPADLPLGA